MGGGHVGLSSQGGHAGFDGCGQSGVSVGDRLAPAAEERGLVGQGGEDLPSERVVLCLFCESLRLDEVRRGTRLLTGVVGSPSGQQHWFGDCRAQRIPAPAVPERGERNVVQIPRDGVMRVHASVGVVERPELHRHRPDRFDLAYASGSGSGIDPGQERIRAAVGADHPSGDELVLQGNQSPGEAPDPFRSARRAATGRGEAASRSARPLSSARIGAAAGVSTTEPRHSSQHTTGRIQGRLRPRHRQPPSRSYRLPVPRST